MAMTRLPDIGLVGPPQVGKDTIGNILIEQHGYTRVSFADPVREMALAIDPIIECVESWVDYDECWAEPVRLSEVINDIGWDRAKVEYPEVRRLLQHIGTDAVRNIIGPFTWINHAVLSGRLDPEYGPYVFTDVRFVNEADFIRLTGGKLVRVIRQYRSTVAPSALTHNSETDLVAYTFDDQIDNSTEDLDALRLQVSSLIGTYLAELPEA